MLRDLRSTSVWIARSRGRVFATLRLATRKPWAIDVSYFDAPAGAGAFYRKCGFRERGRTAYRGNPLVYFEMPV